MPTTSGRVSSPLLRPAVSTACRIPRRARARRRRRHRVLAVRKGDDLIGGIAVYERDTESARPCDPVCSSSTTASSCARKPRLFLRAHLRLLRSRCARGEARARGYVRVELRTRAPFCGCRPFQARGWTRDRYTATSSARRHRGAMGADSPDSCAARRPWRAKRPRTARRRALRGVLWTARGAARPEARAALSAARRLHGLYDELRDKGLRASITRSRSGARRSLPARPARPSRDAHRRGGDERGARGRRRGRLLRWKVFEHLAGDGYSATT